MASSSGTRRRVLTSTAALALLVAACGIGGGDDRVEVRPFSEVQASELVFETNPLDPQRGIFRVETTEPMICAIVWGETEALGRFNNSLAMDGTGITQHDVDLPDVEPGRRYHFIVQGTTADGTLYRSEPGTFTIPVTDGSPGTSKPSVAVGPNLAPDATVVAVSSEFSERFAASNAIDGDLATAWSTSGDGDAGSITLDLGEPRRIAAVEFVTRSMADGSAITSTFTVQVDGGSSLGPFAASSPAAARVASVDLTAQVLRFDVERSSGGNVGALEIRVYAPPG